jgi:hypothetical protein
MFLQNVGNNQPDYKVSHAQKTVNFNLSIIQYIITISKNFIHITTAAFLCFLHSTMATVTNEYHINLNL